MAENSDSGFGFESIDSGPVAVVAGSESGIECGPAGSELIRAGSCIELMQELTAPGPVGSALVLEVYQDVH